MHPCMLLRVKGLGWNSGVERTHSASARGHLLLIQQPKIHAPPAMAGDARAHDDELCDIASLELPVRCLQQTGVATTARERSSRLGVRAGGGAAQRVYRSRRSHHLRGAAHRARGAAQ